MTRKNNEKGIFTQRPKTLPLFRLTEKKKYQLLL